MEVGGVISIGDQAAAVAVQLLIQIASVAAAVASHRCSLGGMTMTVPGGRAQDQCTHDGPQAQMGRGMPWGLRAQSRLERS